MIRTLKMTIGFSMALLLSVSICVFFSSKVFAAEKYTYTLSNGVTITTDKNLDSWIANPTGNGKKAEIHVEIQGKSGEALISAETKNNNHWEGADSWTLKPDSSNRATIDIKTGFLGRYTLSVTTSGGTAERDFYIRPKTPAKIEIVTTNNKVFFNTMSASPYECGDYTWVAVTESGKDSGHFEVKNQVSLKDSSAYTGLKAGKKYKFSLFGYETSFPASSAVPVEKNIVMGPNTKPVISKIKTSGVKVSKKTGWYSGKWQTQYTTSWKVTVSLKKKAKNNLGLEIHDGVDGIYAKSGKNKKTYSFSMKRITYGYSYKGQTMKYSVRTYSSKACKAYSPWSSVKKSKIK